MFSTKERPIIATSSEILFVPVHRTRLSGVSCISIGRLPDGAPTGLAFTSLDRMAAGMGPVQEWLPLCEGALRAALAPLGIHRIQVDAARIGLPVSHLAAVA